MRASHIEIAFYLNVCTRTHFSLRAQITSNSNFYRYVTRTIHNETYGILSIFRAKKYTY